jgi:hypothetical protein
MAQKQGEVLYKKANTNNKDLILSMRKYQAIWEAVKQQHKAALIAPMCNHLRIIKAVRKEKTMDTAWHLLTSESKEKYKLKETIIGKEIHFYLEEDTSNYISGMSL